MNTPTETAPAHPLTDVEAEGRALHALWLAEAHEWLAEAIAADDFGTVMRAAV